jgi:hypothetical protein
MSIDKRYYTLNEVATKQNITVQNLLHLGSTGRIEIVASITSDITPTVPYTEQQINEFEKSLGIDCVQQEEKEWFPVIGHACHFFVCNFDMLRQFEIERCNVAHTSFCRQVYVLNEQDMTYSKKSFCDYTSQFKESFRSKIIGYCFNFKLFDIQTEASVDCATIGVSIDDLYIMHTELDRFIKAQSEPTPETKEPKELNTNERNSLHALIYALTLKDVEADMLSAIPHDADAKQTDTASKLKRRLDKQGINLTEKTIRNHIKSAHTTAQELKNSQYNQREFSL